MQANDKIKGKYDQAYGSLQKEIDDQLPSESEVYLYYVYSLSI